jgi:hypothetical protein
MAPVGRALPLGDRSMSDRYRRTLPFEPRPAKDRLAPRPTSSTGTKRIVWTTPLAPRGRRQMQKKFVRFDAERPAAEQVSRAPLMAVW